MLLVAGCGLESNGLDELGDEGDGSAGNGLDATTQQGDGTINVESDGANPNEDATVSGEDGSRSETSAPEDSGADGADGNESDGGAPDASDGGGHAGSDAGSDAGFDSGVDAGQDAGSPCPTSSGFVCTSQAVPAGWTVVAYDDSAGPLPSCSGAYASPTSVYEGPFPPATCGCSCSVGTPGSCTTGNFSVDLGTGACTAPSGPFPANQCNAIVDVGGFPLAPNDKESGTALPAYAPGSCSANGTETKPPVNPNGLVCSGPSPSGAVCPNDGACVPGAPSGFTLCIEQSGTPSCPAGFTSVVHTVGSSIADTRGCSACTCTGPDAGCDDPTVTFYTNDTCADAGVATVSLNGCNNVVLSGGSTSATAHSYQYSATVTGEACGSGASDPTGGVALDGTATICCQ
jgi:hypothetical protein